MELELNDLDREDREDHEDEDEDEDNEGLDELDHEDREREDRDVHIPRTVAERSLLHDTYRRNLMHRNAEDCFSDILNLEDECSKPDFIDWMVERGFSINRAFSESSMINDYVITTKSSSFETIGRALEQDEIDVLREDIRAEYDYYIEENNKRIMKRAGIATAMGLTLVSLITGLSLGLKRSGNDIVHKSKPTKASKLTPAIPRTIPWTEIQEASGKGLIFIGDHIYVVIGGTLLYFNRRFYTRRASL